MPRNATNEPTRRPPRLNPRDRTLERVASRRIAADRLLDHGARVLAAVSGGADSIALLHFLATERERKGRPESLAVGHVNHGIRGRHADEDAAFVKEASARLDLPFLEAKLPENAFPRRGGPRSGSAAALVPEDLARRLRYEALRQLAARAGADVIALAHTVDDQAETVLFRMARGAGLRGLAGIASRARVHGVRVIRPLLDVTREQVVEYLGRHDLGWSEDASNASLEAMRNYLRHEVLPRLRERVNPAIREALVRQADLFRELDGYLESEARRVLPGVVMAWQPGKIELDARRLVSYPKLLRSYIFRCVLHDLDGAAREVSTAHVEVLHSLATDRRGRSADLPMGVRVCRSRGRMIVTGPNPGPTGESAGCSLHPTVETSGSPADSRKGNPAE